MKLDLATRIARLGYELDSANGDVVMAILALRSELGIGDDVVTIDRGAWRAVEVALTRRNAASEAFWTAIGEARDPLGLGGGGAAA